MWEMVLELWSFEAVAYNHGYFYFTHLSQREVRIDEASKSLKVPFQRARLKI
jgi:hypothetical protein